MFYFIKKILYIMESKICIICGKEYFKGNYSNKQWSNSKYCSMECRKTSSFKICPICGKEFYGKKKAKYCSRICCSKSKIGFIPWNKGTKGIMKSWNKGLTKDNNESLMRISIFNTGKHLTDETKEKLRQINLGTKLPDNHPFKQPHEERSWVNTIEYKKYIDRMKIIFKDRIFTDEWKKKISESKIGEKNSMWMGGISNNPYPIKWNNCLRESIRQRDKYVCQECGVHQDELSRRLSVHHIDYNKDNLSLDNLISLCHTCHMKTNINREYWIEYFKRKIEDITRR